MPSQRPLPLPNLLPDAPPVPRAKPLPRHLPLAAPPPDLLPARMINEVLYCERLLFLEWVQGEFTDNVFTVEGRVVHKRADEPGGDLPPAPDAPAASADPTQITPPAAPTAAAADDEDDDEPPRPYEARSLWLSSETLGITAKIDVVEGDASGTVVPIEYKRGAAPDLPEGAYLPERAQVCAQALVLREHGYRCEAGAIYFARSRRRVPIAIDESLIAITLGAVRRAREVAARAELPPPLVDSPKCAGCSLVGICLPDEVTLLRRLEGVEAEDLPEEIDPTAPLTLDLDGPLENDPWGLAGPEDAAPVAEVRRLHAARTDKLPVYVQEQGARVSLDGDRLVVRGRETGTTYARLPQTSQVVLYGNVQVSTQALRELLVRGIPLSFFSGGGWYYGRASGTEPKNVDLRVAQHRGAADAALSLRLARGFVVSKIKNCRTMLRAQPRGRAPRRPR